MKKVRDGNFAYFFHMPYSTDYVLDYEPNMGFSLATGELVYTVGEFAFKGLCLPVPSRMIT